MDLITSQCGNFLFHRDESNLVVYCAECYLAGYRLPLVPTQPPGADAQALAEGATAATGAGTYVCGAHSITSADLG